MRAILTLAVVIGIIGIQVFYDPDNLGNAEDFPHAATAGEISAACSYAILHVPTGLLDCK